MTLKFIITIIIIADFFLGCSSKVVPLDCVGNQCVANIIIHKNIYPDNNISRFQRKG